MKKKNSLQIVQTSHGDFSLDIIVLSHNNKKITKDFLSFLYKNSKSDCFSYRLVMVDNGSTDGTQDFLVNFLEKKENATLILSKKNTGVIKGRNLGYYYGSENTSSEFLMFLDNDQFVQKRWLDQHLGLISLNYDLIGVEAWVMTRNLMPSRRLTSLNQAFNYVGCGGMVVRRKVIQSIGLFDVGFSPAYFEDPDFCIRAYKAGFKIGWNSKAKICHLGHQTLGTLSTSNKKEKFMRSWKYFRSKWKYHSLPYINQLPIPSLGIGDKN